MIHITISYYNLEIPRTKKLPRKTQWAINRALGPFDNITEIQWAVDRVLKDSCPSKYKIVRL